MQRKGLQRERPDQCVDLRVKLDLALLQPHQRFADPTGQRDCRCYSIVMLLGRVYCLAICGFKLTLRERKSVQTLVNLSIRIVATDQQVADDNQMSSLK